MKEPCWWVYLLDCDGRLYTGVSTDPERRFREHVQGGARGARFTRGARRLELRYAVPIGGRGEAQSVEYRLKQLSRREKQEIVREAPSTGELIQRLQTAREVDGDKAPG